MGPPVATLASTPLPDAVAIQSHRPQTLEVPEPCLQDFWVSDVWYYPVNDKTHQAIAVIFTDDRVSRMQFLGGDK